MTCNFIQQAIGYTKEKIMTDIEALLKKKDKKGADIHLLKKLIHDLICHDIRYITCNPLSEELNKCQEELGIINAGIVGHAAKVASDNRIFHGGSCKFDPPEDKKMYRSCDLSGALLDKAVAIAMGFTCIKNVDQMVESRVVDGLGGSCDSLYFYSACLAVIDNKLRIYSPSSGIDGWDIVKKERISIVALPVMFEAYMPAQKGRKHLSVIGEEPLIAAMRAFVFHRLGEEVRL